MNVYNQTIDGDVACAITAAVGGQTQVEQKSSCTLKIRGGVRGGQPWQESWQGSIDTMGNERDSGCQPRSDIICVGIDLYNQCTTGGVEDLE